MRTPHDQFPEYHTSADNPEFVAAESLANSWATLLGICSYLEWNGRFVNRAPKGEPQLSRWGVYDQLPAGAKGKQVLQAVPWVLNFSDGEHDLLSIAELSQVRFTTVAEAAFLLHRVGLLQTSES